LHIIEVDTHTTRLVNPYHKPESLLSLNPRGLVPTLQYDNKPLYESTVICEFLDEIYPEPPLFPKDPYNKAKTRIWIDFINSRVLPSLYRFLQFQPLSDAEGLKKAQQEFLGFIKQFLIEMDPDGPYFWGEDATMVDFIIAPWIVGWQFILCQCQKPDSICSFACGSSITIREVLGLQPKGKVGKTKLSGLDSGNGLLHWKTGRA
jgi:glutathione S-transferase